MGNFISSLKGRSLAVKSDLINTTGSKLREYYCSYRSICQNFVISVPEYIQIFGYDVKSFEIWDTNKEGFINAFEIFTGLIIFSQINFQQKMRFLYESYDLNEEGFFDYETLLFMFETVCSSTIKLYSLPEDILNQNQINEFLDEYFTEDTQIKCEQLIAWCYRTHLIPEFFMNINREFSIKQRVYKIDSYTPRKQALANPNVNRKKSRLNLDDRFLNMLKNNKVIQENSEKNANFNPFMQWIYGININNISKPVKYFINKNYKSSNQRLIYISGKNIVQLFPKLNKQSVYSRHENPVSVIQISKRRQIIASGQFGSDPTIHIWNMNTLQTIVTFPQIQKSSIKHLKFLNNDSRLIITAERQNTPLILLNLQKRERELSTYCEGCILEIVSLGGMEKEKKKVERKKSMNVSSLKEDEFYIIMKNSIAACRCENLQYEIQSKKNTYKNIDISIKETLLLYRNDLPLLLLLDSHNCFWAYSISGSTIFPIHYPQRYETHIRDNEKDTNQHFLHKNIKQIINSEKRSHFYILESNSITLCRLQEVKDPQFNQFNTESKMAKTNTQLGQNYQIVNVLYVDTIPNELYNGNMVQLIEADLQNLIVVSEMGDIIKIQNYRQQFATGDLQNEEHELSRDRTGQKSLKNSEQHNTFFQNFPDSIKYKKYYQVFKIQEITGICLISTAQGELNILQVYQNSSLDKFKQNLLVSCGNLLYEIDQKERQLTRFTVFEEKIIHIDAYENICALATQSKHTIIMKNGVIVQRTKNIDVNMIIQKNLQELESQGFTINAIKITRDFFIIASEGFLLIYSKTGGEYLKAEPKKVKMEVGTPIHITATSAKKIFLVMTKEKLILKLDLESKDKNVIYSAKQINCDSLCTLYPDAMGLNLPLFFSENKSIYLIAQPSGEIYFWNSLAHILNESQSYSELSGHSSTISSILFKKEQNCFISGGHKDGLIIQWGNRQSIIEEETNPNEQGFGEKVENSEKKKSENLRKFIGMQKLYIEEIKCLKQRVIDEKVLKDSAIQILVRDNDNYKSINKIINSILLPQNLEIYEPLLQKKNILSSENIKLKKSMIRQDSLSSIQFSYVYGFNSEQVRQSILYAHQYSQEKINEQNEEQCFNKKLSYSKFEKFAYAKNKLEPIDKIHETCKRSFVYFSGRVCILVCPQTKKQRFYNYHKNRVTALSIHPNKNIICSAELSHDKAIMQIWDIKTLSLLEEIKTSHSRFISKIRFSNNGNFILSLGGFARAHSLEIHKIQNQESYAFRRIQNIEIYDIQWDPYETWQLAVCGSGMMGIFKISNKTFNLHEKCYTETPEEDITCMAYTSNMYGNKIESDIIMGNSFGDLSMFICGKYIKCKRGAHNSIINCLRMTELFRYKTALISAGEDNFVKIWDTKFNEIGRISTVDTGVGMTYPQSIDMFCCQQKIKKGESKENSGKAREEGLLLVGMRNGSILQVKISEQYFGLAHHYDNSENIDTNKQNSENWNKAKHNINFNIFHHYTALPSSSLDQANFDIKDNCMVTYFFKNSYLTLWNIDKNQYIKSIQLSGYPSVVKFSSGNYLAVGFYDGRVQFYEMIADFTLVLRQQKIVLESEHYPTKIVFSKSDSKIAVVCTTREYSSHSFQNNTNLFPEYDLNIQRMPCEQIILYDNFLGSPKSQSGINNLRINSASQAQKLQKHVIENQTDFNFIYWLEFSNELHYSDFQKQQNEKINQERTPKSLLICYTKEDYSKIDNKLKKKMLNESEVLHKESYKFVLYDCTKHEEKPVQNQDFQSLNFAPAIQAIFRFYPELNRGEANLTTSSQYNLKKVQKNQLCDNMEPQIIQPQIYSEARQNTQKLAPFCQMAQIDQFTILGTFDGEILLLKSEHFFNDFLESEQKFIWSKCFRCFDSPITKIAISNNQIYVSSKQSSTIAKLTFNSESQKKSQPLIKSQEQVPKKQIENKSGEIARKEKKQIITKKLKQIFPKRKLFYECKISAKEFYETLQPKNEMEQEKQSDDRKNENNLIELEVKHILGRKAYNKNNNLFIDLKQNIISYSGCNLCLNFYDSVTQKYRQSFIKPDSSVFSSNPEISAIFLAEDKRTLYIGTSEENCQLIIWDISTKTEITHLSFSNFITIRHIKVTFSQKYCIVMAENRKDKNVLFFIRLKNKDILACFELEDQKKQINDFCFLPGEEYRALACGKNYIGEWFYRSQTLSDRQYIFEQQKNSLDSSFSGQAITTFHSVIFIGNIAISSSSDGLLYLWSDRKLIKKQNAHPKSAILSLFVAHDSQVFVSGGVDGKAIIWQLGANFMIQKIFQFSIYDGKDLQLPSKYHIQSVCIGQNDLILGTRSGDIYKFNWSLEAEQGNNQSKQKTGTHSVVLSAFDDDEINSCSFNISSKKLFILTQSGVISVFNLETYEKISEEKMNIENGKIVRMLASKLSNKIFIVLKKGIEIYQYEENDKPGSKKASRFKKEKQSLKYSSSQIKSAVLSLNEKYMALLIAPNHLENSKIEIYDLSYPDDKSFYPIYKVLENIPENIEIIDFSTDNGFLFYKNPEEDETIIDLATKQVINTQQIEFDIEWNEEAKKTNGLVRNICSVYSDDNRLQNAVQVMNHSIIATDEMGSLRIFKQTNQQNSLGYYRIYLQHLNDVFMAILSSDCRILVTVGREDRSIIFWQMNKFQFME